MVLLSSPKPSQLCPFVHVGGICKLYHRYEFIPKEVLEEIELAREPLQFPIKCDWASRFQCPYVKEYYYGGEVKEQFVFPIREVPWKGFFQTPYAKHGLVLPEARELWNGEKVFFVLKERLPRDFEISGLFLLNGRYCYGIFQPGEPFNLGDAKVWEEFSKRFKGLPREGFIYLPIVQRTFRYAYRWIGEKRNNLVFDVRLVEVEKGIVHVSGRGEELERAKEQKRRLIPEPPIEEVAKRPMGIFVVQRHCITREPMEPPCHADVRFQLYTENWKLVPLSETRACVEGWTVTLRGEGQPMFPNEFEVDEEGKPIKRRALRKALQPAGWLFSDYNFTIPPREKWFVFDPDKVVMVKPGEPGAGTYLPGYFRIVDRGKFIKGAQEPSFHEYFLFGKVYNGRWVCRKVEMRKVEFVKREKDRVVRELLRKVLPGKISAWLWWRAKDQSRFEELKRRLGMEGLKFHSWGVRDWEVKRKGKELLEIEGIAIGVGETLRGHIYSRDALREAAGTLLGAPIDVDHVTDWVVGKVTDSWFEEPNIKFKGVVWDDEIIQALKEGRIKGVSVDTFYSPQTSRFVDGVILGKPLWFRRLSLCFRSYPASPLSRVHVSKYRDKVFCSSCGKWYPRVSRNVREGRNGYLYCVQCGCRVRTKPKMFGKRRKR